MTRIRLKTILWIAADAMIVLLVALLLWVVLLPSIKGPGDDAPSVPRSRP